MSYIDRYCAEVLPRWERLVTWLYRDSIGLLTTAGGVMLPSLAAHCDLPWRMPDGTPAGNEAKITEWQRVKAMPAGLIADAYRSSRGLELDDLDMLATTRAMVESTDRLLRVHFAVESYPEAAQLALLDMGYNLGVTRLTVQYPRFCAAVFAERWAMAAEECLRDAKLEAFADRNQWTVNQFHLAEVS